MITSSIGGKTGNFSVGSASMAAFAAAQWEAPRICMPVA
jgi:hypothetical protein